MSVEVGSWWSKPSCPVPTIVQVVELLPCDFVKIRHGRRHVIWAGWQFQQVFRALRSEVES